MANEKRLIDANALEIEIVRTKITSKELKQSFTVRNVVACIQNAPTVDAVEVVHGEWLDGCSVHDGKLVYHSIDCSVCNGVFKDKHRTTTEYWKEQFKICPFCGAKMDGDGNV